jgi:drug/metabolite transporter (DMT)-like permease
VRCGDHPAGSREILGFVLVAVSAASFGTMAIFATYAYRGGASVLGVVVLRFALAAAVLWAVVWRRRLRPWPEHVLSLWILGGILYAMQAVLFLQAVRLASPALAALFLYVYPVLVVILSAILRRGAIRRMGVLGLISASVGLLLVLGQGGRFSWVGAFLALGAAAVYSTYILFGQQVIARSDPIVAAAHIALSAVVTLTLAGLVLGGLDFQRFTLEGYLYAALIGLIPGALAIFAFLAGLERIGAARSAIISMLEPVVTVMLSALLLGEGLAPVQLLGGVLVVAGGLGTMLPARAAKAPAPSGQSCDD